MSEEQRKAFIEKVQNDTSPREKLKAASNTDTVVAITKAADFVISADLLNKTVLETDKSVLENAGGGSHFTCQFVTGKNRKEGISNYQSRLHSPSHRSRVMVAF